MVRGAIGFQLPRLFIHVFSADASRAKQMQQNPELCREPRRGRRGCLPEAGKGGQGGAGSDGPPS